MSTYADFSNIDPLTGEPMQVAAPVKAPKATGFESYSERTKTLIIVGVIIVIAAIGIGVYLAVAGSSASVTSTFTVTGSNSTNGLVASNVTTTGCTLTYPTSAGIYYNILISSNGGTTYTTLVTSTSGGTYQVTGLTAGSYQFEYVTVTQSGIITGSPSSPIIVIIPAQLATPVLTSANVAPTAATINWTAIPSATSYTLTMNPGAVVTAGITATTINLTNLGYNTSYSFSLVAVSTDTAHFLPSTAGTLSLTTTTATNQVGNLTATQGNSTSIQLDWTAPSGGQATGYSISTLAQGANTPVVTTTSVTNAILTGLTPSTQYFITVSTVTASGTVAAVDPLTTITATTPSTGLLWKITGCPAPDASMPLRVGVADISGVVTMVSSGTNAPLTFPADAVRGPVGLQGSSSYTGYTTVSTNYTLSPAFTIAGWYNPTALSSTIASGIFGPSNTAAPSGRYYALTINSPSGVPTLTATVKATPSGTAYSCSTTAVGVATGTWAHAVMTFSLGGVLSLYVNGALVQSVTMGSTDFTAYNNNTSLPPFVVGGSITASFYGALNDVEVWSSALTLAQIDALYNFQSTHP